MHYTLDWHETAYDLLPFTCTIDNQVFFLKAQFNAAHQLTELSQWQENWQEISTKLVFSDYQLVQEQSIPLQVEVLEKDTKGLLFVNAEFQVTDVVQKGPMRGGKAGVMKQIGQLTQPWPNTNKYVLSEQKVLIIFVFRFSLYYALPSHLIFCVSTHGPGKFCLWPKLYHPHDPEPQIAKAV
ncbi:MAG: hypothetical protein IPO07_24955 [Haliscomenobacter sp.]|nr:hypothetical protein [Haliscomenobacter sp.]MBK9491687.1 hypothetical protein [Haliscomenobacter sp.]